MPWKDLLHNAGLCKQVFSAEKLVLEMNGDEIRWVEENCHSMDTQTSVGYFVLLSSIQFRAKRLQHEHQFLCALPLRELSYALAKACFGEESMPAVENAIGLMEMYFLTGCNQQAVDLGNSLLENDILTEGAVGARKVAEILIGLGIAYGRLGDPGRKIKLIEHALKIQTQLFGSNSKEVASTLSGLAATFGDLGNYQKQRLLLEHALQLQEQLLGKDHEDIAVTLNNLGIAYGELGDVYGKKAVLQRALSINQKHFGPESDKAARCLMNLGNAYGQLGNYLKMKDLLEEALKIQEMQFGADHPEVAKTLANLGNACGHFGNHVRSRAMLERALQIEENHFGPNNPEVAMCLYSLANACGELGDYHQMQVLLERFFGLEHPLVAQQLRVIGALCQQYGADCCQIVSVLEAGLDSLEREKDRRETQMNLARLRAASAPRRLDLRDCWLWFGILFPCVALLCTCFI